MRVQPWTFLALACLAFYNLWIRMMTNGTLAAIGDIKASETLPSGKHLTLSYTGIPPLDDGLATLVIFFDPLLDALNPSGRILMLDVLITLHSAILWITVESQRGYAKHWVLNMTAVFGFLWNASGAGMILPLYGVAYFAFHPRKTTPPSIAEAQALLPSLLIGSFALVAIALGAPLVFAGEPEPVQQITAAFQFGPVIFVALQKTLSLLMPQMRGTCIRQDQEFSKQYVKACYMVTAVVGGATHLFCLLSIALAGKESGVTLVSVYWPRPQNVVPGSKSNLPDGSMLFMHYDQIFITLTCWLWAILILQERLHWSIGKAIGRGIALAAVSVLLGPACLLGTVLSYTEDVGSIVLE